MGPVVGSVLKDPATELFYDLLRNVEIILGEPFALKLLHYVLSSCGSIAVILLLLVKPAVRMRRRIRNILRDFAIRLNTNWVLLKRQKRRPSEMTVIDLFRSEVGL